MEGEHTHDIPVVTPVVHTAGETANALVEPVVDHTDRIRGLEERHGQLEGKLFDEIGRVRGEIESAINNSTSGWNERISGLENKLSELLAQASKVPEEAVEPVADVVSKAPEVVVETPEKAERYVRRFGRKVKVKE